MNNNIKLVRVQASDKTRLWNLFQKFLYEMTNFYDDELDEEGNLHYGHFESYFDGDESREAYFIYHDETMVGFMMLNRYSHIGADIDRAIAEFTVFPMYRRRHLAYDAASAIISSRRGSWEIKYNEKNLAAKALWTKVSDKYEPTVHHLNDMETVLSFTV